MKGQKEAVLELVYKALPSFTPRKDIALVMLSKQQLEFIKDDVYAGIVSGAIEYNKPIVPVDVRVYARSMVMNHLKKAKELNGNQVYGQTADMVQSRVEKKKLASLHMDVLPEDLKNFVKTLV